MGSLLWLAVSLTPLTTKNADLKVEYLGEIELIIETALTRGSGAQVDLYDEKSQRSRIS
jgi:hypothetical protein